MLRIVVAVLVSIVSATSALAQPARYSVQGKVLDPMGAPIASADVVAASDRSEAPVPAKTDQRGDFSLSLQPGRYTITVTTAGFVDAVRRVTVSDANVTLSDVVLRIAGVHDTVSVTALDRSAAPLITSATKMAAPLRDIPQSITVVSSELIQHQLMSSVGDVVRYVPGITSHQGENNRDQVIIRGNNSSADFFLNGVRDDVQYYRDLYNLDRIEALKGPNSMIFGRGGGGGVINRVTKEAGFTSFQQFTLQGGEYGNRRMTADVDQRVNGSVAIRLNGMYENSDSFRNGVGLERYGVNPTVTIVPSQRTEIRIAYEHLHDTRVADRGISSFQGRPADVDIATFYGNPDASHVLADVNIGSALVEHRAGRLLIRNSTSVANYDRSYQNFVPGAVAPTKSQVTLTAYNNATDRTNVFNQTDLLFGTSIGGVQHSFAVGAEIGRQLTDNFRNTGFFNNTATAVLVPYANPTVRLPVTFRQNATDANNHLRTIVAATYAQDVIALSRRVQLIGGLRFDRFDLQYHNNRNGDTLARPDNLISPRAGLVFKATPSLSAYGSYTVSYLPSSGDQFSSLTAITQQVKPEQFQNYEIGLKWDVSPELSLTTAVYQLNRTNTRSTDPNDPTRIVQTGSQRTNGYELGANGRVIGSWRIAGGYAYQDAFVTHATVSAAAGARVAQVPHHTASLWNEYAFHPRVSGALGLVYRDDMYAAIDNTVTLPGYTRADAAAFVSLTRNVRLQANVENLFNKRYYLNADNNTNISPGSPRALRVALSTRF